MRWELSGSGLAILLGAASRICSKQRVSSFYSFHQAFSPRVPLGSKVVQPYRSIDTVTTWKNSGFILLKILDFHVIDNVSMAVNALIMRESKVDMSLNKENKLKRILTSLSLDDILLLRYMNRGSPFNKVMTPWNTCSQFYLSSSYVEIWLDILF